MSESDTSENDVASDPSENGSDNEVEESGTEEVAEQSESEEADQQTVANDDEDETPVTWEDLVITKFYAHVLISNLKNIFIPSNNLY